MVTVASTANRSLHKLQTFNSENKNHHQDACFSSYLHSNEGGGTFVGKLAESSQNLNPFISNRKDSLRQGEKKEEDEEIEVFEAEMYFNGGEMQSPRVANIAARKYQHQKDEQIALETRKYKARSGTPSVRSESSWNSQSALLHSGTRSSSRNKKNKVQLKSFLGGLGSKCSCSGQNSVDISHHAGEISFNKTATPKKLINAGIDVNHSVKIIKPHAELLIDKIDYLQKPEKLGVGLNRENDSAFSDVNSGLGNQPVKMQHPLGEEEKPRKSLDVFGSLVLDNRSKSLSFDKRLTMPSRHATPKMEEIYSIANSGGNYNDAASDASSDLFEIESLTVKSNPFLARQTREVSSSCVTPTTSYAPSEASIEWSVTTASAAELKSDFEEQRSVTTIKSAQGHLLPSMLLGCKSHEAVRVAGDAFIIHDKPSSNSKICRSSETSR